MYSFILREHPWQGQHTEPWHHPGKVPSLTPRHPIFLWPRIRTEDLAWRRCYHRWWLACKDRKDLPFVRCWGLAWHPWLSGRRFRTVFEIMILAKKLKLYLHLTFLYLFSRMVCDWRNIVAWAASRPWKQKIRVSVPWSDTFIRRVMQCELHKASQETL